MYDIKSIGSATFSPDGSAILYAISQTDRESGQNVSQVWVCDPDGRNQRQVSQNGKTNAGPVWSPDGPAIAWSSRRDGDHPGAIVVLSLDGGDARIVTSHLNSPSSLAWSPDGKSIAYVVEIDPDNLDEEPPKPGATPPVTVIDRLDYKLDGRGIYNRKRRQIHVVDVETGDRKRLTGLDVTHSVPRWSPDGQTIACIVDKVNNPASTIALIDIASGIVTTQDQVRESVGNLWWIPDGSGLLFLGSPNLTPHPDYYTFNIATGTSHPVTVDNHFLPDIGYQNTSVPGEPVWLSTTNVLVHGLLNGASGLWELNTKTGITTERARWNAMHGGLSATPDGKIIVQNRATMRGKGELVTWNSETDVTTTIIDPNLDFFTANPTADWETLSINRAGLTIEGWLLKPRDFDPSRTYPLVLSVHGGPHNAYGYTFDVAAQVMATNGYLVLMTNPRGSGTYGRAFAEAVVGDWGGEDWLDLQAMLDLACERSYVDSSRIGIYGYSYGGYMTAWAIGQTNRFGAAICGAPVYDMISMYGTSDIGYYFTPMELKADPFTERDKLLARSPSTFGHLATTPTLIIQGDADERCPAGQAEQMFTDLKLSGCEVQLARYPGGSHLMLAQSPAPHRIDYLERVLGWFDAHLT